MKQDGTAVIKYVAIYKHRFQGEKKSARKLRLISKQQTQTISRHYEQGKNYF